MVYILHNIYNPTNWYGIFVEEKHWRISQLTYTFSKSAIEALERSVKCVQS